MGHNRTDIHINSQRVLQYTQDFNKFKPEKSQLRGVEVEVSTLNKEALCNPYLLGKGESVFSNAVFLGITVQVSPHGQV